LTAFAETGIWFSDITEGFYQKQRIMYPDITGLSRIDFTCNREVVLKEEYEHLINAAKHRMVDDGRYRLIYVPKRSGIQYELYDTLKDPAYSHSIINEQPLIAAKLKRRLFDYLKQDAQYTLDNEYMIPTGYIQ
jgi:hypothetical protein